MRSIDLPDEMRRLMAPRLAKEFYGPSPGIFIGVEGYPKVNAGPLGIMEKHPLYDNPASWLSLSYRQIIGMRAATLRANKQENIFSKERFVRDLQEISLASLPTDVEMIFSKKPSFSMNFDRIVQPLGASGKLEKLRITENPKIDQKVDKIVSDDLRAAPAAELLYKHGMDVYKITTILSSGILGIDTKLVPTRWSITATDDIIAKSLLHDVRTYSSINEIMVFEAFNLDNRFIVLMMPGSWEFENFESCPSGSQWYGLEEEYEPFSGRTCYAEKQAGGYYASRLGVVEYLHKIRRQARVVVFREIYEGYSVPLGVWQVRENVRKAFSATKKFDTTQGALTYIAGRLRHPIGMYLQKSKILRQKRLSDF
ncbi:MAG TPA: hypothetical protein VJB05_00985 [archaeon]|nr:hypothetical protein [archaeon]